MVSKLFIIGGLVVFISGFVNGQLPSKPPVKKPTKPTRKPTVQAALIPAAIASGGDSTCAVGTSGLVKCWGAGLDGQLGNGNEEPVGDTAGETKSAGPVNLGKAVRVSKISGGTNFHCAVLTTGQVKCWGGNEHGQLGLGDNKPRGVTLSTMGDALPIVNLGTGFKAAQLVSNYGQSCAITPDEKMKCWGANNFGQLGDGTNQDRGLVKADMGDALKWVAVGKNTAIKQVALGYGHTCVITAEWKLSNGRRVYKTPSLLCWGRNTHGQIGIGNTNLKDGLPNLVDRVNLGVGRYPKRVACGADHTCVVMDNDEVKCWGLGFDGQLGSGKEVDYADDETDTPDKIPSINLGSGLKAKDVFARNDRTCVQLTDDRFKCFGKSYYGEGGIGAAGQETSTGDSPSEMGDALKFQANGSKIKTLAMGEHFNCGLFGSDVKCVGYNFNGQLGLGSTDETSSYGGVVQL